ncbi:hypothetical protein FEM33_12895 [Dyadobacter flavalbus]|uniref:Lipoprotein n=1 Tax=Dyadobacter flavalbus TaxID=2579942 RepID=A0A5M8QXM7_9BACT|nr:hypothetical protein [Dyadobacter flavalbus]KAA6439173.1 hypothetical protein FEM33_12895 [Dyadobacter flavalbus]
MSNYMKPFKHLYTRFLVLSLLTTSCEYPFNIVMLSQTWDVKQEAERRYYTKSKTSFFFDRVNYQTLEFKGDTMILTVNDKIMDTIYLKDDYWLGKQKKGIKIFKGISATTKEHKSIRCTVEHIKDRGLQRLVTSEIMTGDYNPAADTVWTYYELLPNQF